MITLELEPCDVEGWGLCGGKDGMGGGGRQNSSQHPNRKSSLTLRDQS